MFKKIRIKNGFTHQDRTIDLSNGLTGITGKNWSGKSLILEFLQYALWGAKALRGIASDYKKLEVEVEFFIKGADYTVIRSPKIVILYRGEEPVASGTTAVNLAINELFGYSHSVFSVANAINQGKIEELGSMRAADRKKLVDETIGLNVLDELVKFISEEAKVLGTKIDTISSLLVQPIEPTAPEGYEPSAVLHSRMDELTTLKSARDILESQASRKIVWPTEPVCPGDMPLLGELKTSMVRRAELAAVVASLSGQVKAIPDATLSESDWAAAAAAQADFNAWTAESKAYISEVAQRERQRVQAEKSDTSIFNTALSQWEKECLRIRIDYLNAVGARNNLAEQIVSNDCPACHHHWETGPVLPPEPVMGNLPARPLKQQMVLEFSELLPLRSKPETPKYSTEELQLLRRGLDRAEEKAKLKAELNEKATAFGQLSDNSGLIAKLEKYAIDFAQYQSVQQATAVLELEVSQAMIALMDSRFLELDKRIADLRFLHNMCVIHEANAGRYVKDKLVWEAKQGELILMEEERTSWGNARKAVTDLRAKVKAYLLPSLNTVASLLMCEMTGGVLNTIVVDDTFEISVAGQRLETLSGAGKAIANLALRIGLGQVLTNKTFGVLLADEVDASMDDEQATYVAACLRRLTKQIPQIIQVSHKKDLIADCYVRL